MLGAPQPLLLAARTPHMPAVARTAFARLAGLLGSARYEPAPMSSRCAGMSDATTGAPARSASITGSESPSSKDGTTTTLAPRQESVHLLVAEPLGSARLALAHGRGNRPVVHAIPRTGHADHDHVPGFVVGCRSSDAGQSAERVLAGIVTRHHHDRARRCPRRTRRLSEGSTSRGHATSDFSASGPSRGRPSREPSSVCARWEMHTNSSYSRRASSAAAYSPREARVAEVDGRVVPGDEVEDDGDLARSAVQQGE